MIYENFEYNTSSTDEVKVDALLIKGFFKDQCIWCEMYLPVIDEVICNDPTLEMLQYEFPSSNDYSNTDLDIMTKFNISHFPSLIAFDSKGAECNRVTGLLPEEGLKNWISEIKFVCK